MGKCEAQSFYGTYRDSLKGSLRLFENEFKKLHFAHKTQHFHPISHNQGPTFRASLYTPLLPFLPCYPLPVLVRLSLSFLWITERVHCPPHARTHSLRGTILFRRRRRTSTFSSQQHQSRQRASARTSTRQSGKHQGKPRDGVGMLSALPHMYVLSDKIPRAQRLQTLFPRVSHSLPWQQGRRQHGRCTTQTFR